MLGIAALVAWRARPDFSNDTRPLDIALALTLAGCVIQLLPFPAALVDVVSPYRESVVQHVQLAPAATTWAPLSVEPASSLHATAVFLAAILLFVGSREVFASRGVRATCRGIAWIGLALSCAAMIQRGMSATRIYGFWVPYEAGALPYGPFVNRNYCATWLVLATPLCIGYLMARLGGQGSRTPARAAGNWVSTMDSRSIWLAIAGTTMVLALAVSLSRSGIMALLIAALVLVSTGRQRIRGAGLMWIAMLAAVGGVAVLAFADLPAVIARFGEGVGSGIGRARIWQDTLPILRDFWPAGTGNGTYQTAMLLYQTGDRTYSFNQAHNHYLHVAAEGGLIVAGPLAMAAWTFVRLAGRRLREDVSGMFWIRAGAAAGLAGVAAQSVWETGLRAPANALLAAVLAALLVHVPAAAVHAREGRPSR